MRPSGAPFLGENLEISEVNQMVGCWFLFLPETTNNNPIFLGVNLNSGWKTGWFWNWRFFFVDPQKTPKLRRKKTKNRFRSIHPDPIGGSNRKIILDLLGNGGWGKKTKIFPNGLMVSFIPCYHPSKKWKKKTQANHKEIVSLISNNIATSRPSWSPLRRTDKSESRRRKRREFFNGRRIW